MNTLETINEYGKSLTKKLEAIWEEIKSNKNFKDLDDETKLFADFYEKECPTMNTVDFGAIMKYAYEFTLKIPEMYMLGTELEIRKRKREN